jgi:transposase
MIQVTPHMRILVALEPLDFRKGMDGTGALCRRVLFEDPHSGSLFVFRNRKGTMIRILVHDGHGLWLMNKRVSQGRFPVWKLTADHAHHLAAHELQLLLVGGDWSKASVPAPWRQLVAQKSEPPDTI